ncbi:hypothetical protein MNBD_GAMMA02-154 [hydrothermal vent metagenome]|uniref:TonB C-terminal domain-containing protein n=1 Tax=hydrothermal vent metagenome TaxID=652676 RepID=A0A3B0VSK6_9ZZZZ
MKHLIILSLLITLSSHAQEGQGQQQKEVKSQNQKRPSWSQGLPERQSSMTPSASMNKFKVNQQSSNTAVDDRSLEMAELPSIGINLVATKPVIELGIESVQPIANSRREAFDQYHNNDKEGIVIAAVDPLVAEYKWTPIKTTPINVPENFDENKTLKLNIHINPKGEVTRVTVADTAIPRKVFKNVEQSILKWKFQAPSEVGITENISKTFSIDIKTDA